jgi:23S rRNA (uracil1939-C5)-methyltransferase
LADARVTATVAELPITALAAGGDGVGRHDGLAVFVPRTAVGDVVRASLVSRGRFARGTVRALLVPSADRVDPPCVHFAHDDCGGCQWQHLRIDAQRRGKAQIVVDAFQRIAGVSIETPDVIGDDRMFGYRRTISFTVRGGGASRTGGFHAAGDPDRIVPVERCLLAHPDLQAAWAGLRTRLARLPEQRAVTQGGADRARGRRGRPQGGASRDLRVSLKRLDDGAVSLVVDGGDQWSASSIRAVAESMPGCRGVWWTPFGGTARLVWDRERSGTPPERRAPTDPEPPPAAAAPDPLDVAASFVQVNAELADRLHAYVLAQVLDAHPRTVLDGYAGAGRLARALDARGVAVTAIERDDRACRYAASHVGPASRVLAGTVESRLGEGLPADVVVLNPPRSGCEAAVCETLSAALRRPEAPGRLVYVSCDPATLARDVRRLEGWRVASVTCFDLFPQTAHVETVCLLLPETT